MIILSSPEYEGKVEYQFRPSHTNRLDTPTDISSYGNSVLFSKVHNATEYSIYLDGSQFATVPLVGTGRSDWLFNELIAIDDNSTSEFSVSFTSNGITYSSLKVYGRNTAPGSTGKYAIYYDSTKVFEERLDSDSLWVEQVYRSVSFASEPTGALLTFLNSTAINQPEQLSIDLSQLTGWEDLEDGNHILQLVARATGILSSFLSTKINFGKNVDFVKGVIYGPFKVLRVVDGDTVVASIHGAEMKIRMIGVNTPESVASSSYGHENCQEGIDASNYTKDQLMDRNVYIEFDTDQYDRYNRYLCYIYLDSQGIQMYNAQLIAQGYGEAQYYSPNGAHRAYLEATQATARANGVGFWGTGFFPTKLVAPVVTLTGSIITWAYQDYVESFDIKDGGTVVHNYIQLTGGLENEFDLDLLGLAPGSHRINVVAKPTNSTHEASNNSNNITYVIQ